MNEKRFELDVRLDMPKLLIDNVTNKRYHLLLVNDIEEIVDLLNEQQAEIERLNKELIKAITKSIPPKKYEDIDKKHKPWKYVNTNCD